MATLIYGADTVGDNEMPTYRGRHQKSGFVGKGIRTGRNYSNGTSEERCSTLAKLDIKPKGAAIDTRPISRHRHCNFGMGVHTSGLTGLQFKSRVIMRLRELRKPLVPYKIRVFSPSHLDVNELYQEGFFSINGTSQRRINLAWVIFTLGSSDDCQEQWVDQINGVLVRASEFPGEARELSTQASGTSIASPKLQAKYKNWEIASKSSRDSLVKHEAEFR
ncbi:uncharacterized protein F5147DRAFT_651727 [Suillus discolor]|uniref:Uncharacterized protein n=1 Tax=Suillus discolor TaxID=1912936 RepID=A0A9P7F9A9_9AGAM|nr:uncharacterized protein F5147DRAFT_651727 [Suillus discolor]KAG2110532.1 hypothetical protein F5147DRAFT_651727 [Suillus discolor]